MLVEHKPVHVHQGPRCNKGVSVSYLLAAAPGAVFSSSRALCAAFSGCRADVPAGFQTWL